MTITNAPEKVEVVPQGKHTLTFLKEVENKRPVCAVKNATGSMASCVCCRETITTNVFVGVQYTYDVNKFSALCVPCAQSLNIVAEESSMSDNTTTEPAKRKRGRPPGSGKRQQAVAAQTTTIKEEETTMGLNLKGKLGKSASGAAAPATPEEKVTSLIEAVVEEGALELEDESETIDLSAAPPWREDAIETVATTNGKKTDTPADLRTRIESVDVPKTTATGITKADVQDIVQACLADTVKSLVSSIKEIKTEVNKALSAVQADVREQIATVMEHVNTVGVSLDSLTKKLDEALTGDEEPTATVSAPTIAITATNAPAVAEAKKTEAPVPNAAKPGTKVPFAEFVRQQVGEEGVRLEPLSDMLLELGYFKAAPDDRARFLSDLTTLLRQRGFKVVDSWVEKA